MSGPPIHATTVALYRPGRGWFGVLLIGPSGAGKSDLALRLVAKGWRLVADDYTHVFASDGHLYGTAPASLTGRIEVRGVGIVEQPTVALVKLGLSVSLTSGPVERLPELEFDSHDQIALPRVTLNGIEASAVEKVTVLSRRL